MRRKRQVQLWLVCAIAATALACAEVDVASAPDAGEQNLRPEPPVPPQFDAGGVGIDGGDEPDGCPESCEPGERRCEGAGYQVCERDETTGCNGWGDIVDCSNPGEACVRGACEIPTGCVDNDGDTYGVQCPAGPDCNDTNAEIHPAAAEVCDGVDNNCDGTTDEGFDVGSACTIGSDTCGGSGTYVCDDDGTGVVCDAQPTGGTPETCNGVDDDCDGIIDNGVCEFCSTDVAEPNDARDQAGLISPDTQKVGYLCYQESDWFELEVQPGRDYVLTVAFPEELSDVRVNGFVDGVQMVSADDAGDGVVISVDGDAGTDFHIEVVNKEAVETYFRIAFADSSAFECAGEDYFAPNQSIQMAFPLISNWLIEAFMCPAFGATGSDWFRLGELQQGKRLTVMMEEYEGVFTDYDLDLHLWTDPDGDNTYTREASRTTFDDLETLVHDVSHTGTHFIEVRDYGGDGADYGLVWSSE